MASRADGLVYLLDTNILSALVREPQGPARRMLARQGEHTACTSIIVAAELRFGAAKAGSPALGARIDRVLELIPVLPLEAGCDRAYARIREQVERDGNPIGPNDLLIAAHALSAGLVVVTANEAEFRRVPGLKVANWLK